MTQLRSSCAHAARPLPHSVVEENILPQLGLETDRIRGSRRPAGAHGRRQPKEKVMTELHAPQRRSSTAKAIFGLLLAVVLVGAFATAGSGTASPERTASRDEGVLAVLRPSRWVLHDHRVEPERDRPRHEGHLHQPSRSKRRVEQRPLRRRPRQQRCLRPRRARSPSSAARSRSPAGPAGSEDSTRPSRSPAHSPPAPLVRGTDRTASPHPARTNRPGVGPWACRVVRVWGALSPRGHVCVNRVVVPSERPPARCCATQSSRARLACPSPWRRRHVLHPGAVPVVARLALWRCRQRGRPNARAADARSAVQIAFHAMEYRPVLIHP